MKGYIGLMEVSDRREVIDKMEEHIQEIEFAGSIMLETSSVYGAIVAIPQVARCMEWNPTMVILFLRTVMMLGINYILQISAIILIGEASQVMDVLAGKMHLCDFAKDLDACPNATGCVGPGGTRFTPPRLYSFDIWSVRMFLRDSLIALMPGQKDEIMANVDPGEYGMENYYGRMMACFLFMLVEVRDLFSIFDLAKLVYEVPTKADDWVCLDEKTVDDPDANRSNEIAGLRFQVAGMPLFWKVFTILTVIVPKLFLWYSVCWIGVRWLMETSGILNCILGAITMDFVLTFDELLFDSIGNPSTKYIMGQITDYQLPESGRLNEKDAKSRRCWRYVMLAIPRRLLLTCFIMAIFVWRYYHLNCKKSEDGTWVSQDMYLPLSSTFSLTDFMNNAVPQASTPYWTMPSEK